jgi:hypothetical protein
VLPWKGRIERADYVEDGPRHNYAEVGDTHERNYDVADSDTLEERTLNSTLRL